ncbi:MAG: serine--tRNA ligase, partial [Lachnospiraceae bacterium]
MLDIKLLRNHFEEVKKALENRNEEFDLDRFQELDGRRRSLLAEVETMKARQNSVSKQIPALKKQGQDVSEVLEEMKELSARVKELDGQVAVAEKELNDWMLTIPNVPHPSVPAGKTDEDNVE